MSAVRKPEPLSVDEYLAGELNSPVKHEYVGGRVYAMSGAIFGHNDIAGNIFVALKNRLRGKPCKPYNSDCKVRMLLDGEYCFYYPDVSVICEPTQFGDTFSDRPTVIFEVLSKSTRRIDEGEKKKAYLANAAVAVYALVETQMPLVTIYRRSGDEFACEVREGLDAVIPLGEIGTDLPLAEIYDQIAFDGMSDE